MDASQLIRLSPEIRNIIYEYVFTSDRAIKLQTNGIQHPLTLTCRQMRNETLRMYLALTAFNAHLDDGPTIPLARWLRTIGPELCLSLRKVSIWDLRTLNGTLYGVEITQRMLREGTRDGETYVLRPVGRQIFHKSWFLKDIKLPLQSMGIGLERFCIVQADGALKQTSNFALSRSSELNSVDDNRAALAEELGLNELEQVSLATQLDQGRREVRLLEGRRNIILKFDSDQRLVSMQQQFIPRDEEFYL